jgi:hypothetical protein
MVSYIREPMKMAVQSGHEQSDLLAALRPADFALLEPHLAEVQMRPGEVIYQPGDPVESCFLRRGGAICS